MSILTKIANKLFPPNKALLKAVQKRDISKVRKAFERGASADAVFRHHWDTWAASGAYDEPILVTAVREGTLDIVQEILKHNPNVQAKTECAGRFYEDALEACQKVVQHADAAIRNIKNCTNYHELSEKRKQSWEFVYDTEAHAKLATIKSRLGVQ